MVIERLLAGRPQTGFDRARVSSFLAANPVLWLDLPDRPDPRREPGWIVPWWWVGADRVIIAAGPGLVVATQPAKTSGRLTLHGCARLTLVGVTGPPPGAVQVARHATLTLTADRLHGTFGETGPRPAHAVVDPTLASLVGRRVTLEARGRTGDEAAAARAQGVVAEAGLLEHHLVVCLEDGTLAVVHRPATIQVHSNGGVVVGGALERVVLDRAGEASVAVTRPGSLVVTPG